MKGGEAEIFRTLVGAHANKPKFGQTCNRCGWCCLSEPCDEATAITGQKRGACELLLKEGDVYSCPLAATPEGYRAIGAGTFCCAKTQAEVIEDLSE